jgi:hypothetical protein
MRLRFVYSRLCCFEVVRVDEEVIQTSTGSLSDC